MNKWELMRKIIIFLQQMKNGEKKTNKQFRSLAHIHENHFGMLREKIIFCRIAKKVYINNKKN